MRDVRSLTRDLTAPAVHVVTQRDASRSHFGGLPNLPAGEEDLGYGRHRLSPVFHAGHAVITAIRELSEGKR